MMRPDTIATRYRPQSPPEVPNRPVSNISLDSPPDSPMSPGGDTVAFSGPVRPLISFRKPDEPDRPSGPDSPTVPLTVAVNSIMSTASPYMSGFSNHDSITEDLILPAAALPAKGKRVEETTEGVVPDHTQGEHPSLVDIPREIMSMVTDPALRKAIGNKLEDVSYNEMDQMHAKLMAAKDRHNRELKATLIRVEKEVRQAFEKELVRQQAMIWHMFSDPKISDARMITPQPVHKPPPPELTPDVIARRRGEPPQQGGTPELWRAMQSSPINRHALQAHLKHGGSPNLINADGYSLLYFALMNNSSHSFNLLMEFGVNIEATLVKGFDVRATHLVAQFDYTKTLQELLENRAALDPKDVHGQTPLFYAVRHESLAAMRMLLQAGANVNLVDAYDYSILYYAVSTKNEESVQMLLRHRALPDYHPEITPLYNALFYNHNLVIAKLLVQYGANLLWTDKSDHHNSLLHKSILRKSHTAARFLIESGCDINSQNNERNTPLYLALRERNMDIVRLLLQCGDKLHREMRNENGATPLHAVVAINSMEGLKLLLKDFPSTPSNINVLDAMGGTPLYYAVHGSTIFMVDLLLANGADPTIPSALSPFLHAVKFGYLDKVRTMLKHSNGWSSYRFSADQLHEALEIARSIASPRQELIHALEQALRVTEQGGQSVQQERMSLFGSPSPPRPMVIDRDGSLHRNQSVIDRRMSQAYGTSPPGVGGFGLPR